MESCLREEIGNSEIFMADFTAFRRDRNTQGGGITCLELWVRDVSNPDKTQ
jgi:hypothetical protein